MELLRNKEKRTPVPITEILALFSGYEEHLLLLLESVGEKMGSKGSEKLGNTTLELYLEKLDDLRTDHDSELYKSGFICINDNYVNNNNNDNNNNNNNSSNNKHKNTNDHSDDNDNNKDYNFVNNYDITTVDSIEEIKSETASNMLIIEDKIMTLLDGDIPYNK